MLFAQSVMRVFFLQAQNTRRVCSPQSSGDMGEEGKEGKAGEDVEFLNTTVTVSHLPSVQFPEATRSNKGTRLVDRWKKCSAKAAPPIS